MLKDYCSIKLFHFQQYIVLENIVGGKNLPKIPWKYENKIALLSSVKHSHQCNKSAKIHRKTEVFYTREINPALILKGGHACDSFVKSFIVN